MEKMDSKMTALLTDEQIDAIWHNSNPTNFEARSFARAVLRAVALALPKVDSEPAIWVKFEDGQLIGWDDIIPDGEYFLAVRSTPTEK